jgi:hypothetical protein
VLQCVGVPLAAAVAASILQQALQMVLQNGVCRLLQLVSRSIVAVAGAVATAWSVLLWQRLGPAAVVAVVAAGATAVLVCAA